MTNTNVATKLPVDNQDDPNVRSLTSASGQKTSPTVIQSARAAIKGGWRFGLDAAVPMSPQLLHNAGATFAARYLPTPWRTWRTDLSPTEAKNLSQHGVQLITVWETTANRAAAGHAAGRLDAQRALAAARLCGQPDDRPIYLAVDFDANGPEVAGYFLGARTVLGQRTGAYAGYRPASYLFSHGLINWLWQTYAWSGGKWHSKARVQQYSNSHTVGGVDCDYNRGYGDFGQWTVGTKPQPYASRTLRQGDQGPDVAQLQRYLNVRLTHRGRDALAVDGDYGPATTRARHLGAYILGLSEAVCDRDYSTVGEQKAQRHPELYFPTHLGDYKRMRARARKHGWPAWRIREKPHTRLGETTA